MKVPFLDLKAQYEIVHREVEDVIWDVMESQQFINGPQVAEFEEAIADYCNCKYAVGVSSGTDALLVSLLALGIGPGDEVITTPYTFVATAEAIARTGARPVFVDIDPNTFNIDPKLIEAAITDDTVAILPVHLFGQMADMTRITAIARHYELQLVEDACQALGASAGWKAGAIGTCGCFSFFPSKNLGGIGDGGMITTNREELASTCRQLRNHGGRTKDIYDMTGGNFRLDTIQAAVLLAKLKHLPEWTDLRRHNARTYDALLLDCPEIIVPPVPESLHVYNQYVIRAPSRDKLKAHLAAAGIGTAIYYPLPLHKQECFVWTKYTDGRMYSYTQSLPVAEAAAEQTLALPIYPELTADQIQYVCDAIKEFYR